MRGIKSEAMILAADKLINSELVVDIVNPPKSSEIGDDLYFKPYIPLSAPSRIKPKVWDEIQKRLFTDEDGQVIYQDFESTGERKSLRLTTKDSDAEGAYVGKLKNASVR